jgi:hypothetical protein
MLRFLARFDKVERRTIYLVLFFAAALPFLVPIRLPLYVWKETRMAYEVTRATKPGQVVAICSNWVAGSQGENWPQYEAVVAHLMLRDIPFIVFSLDSDPLAPQFAEAINERQAARYGRVYGRDWVNLGLTRGAALTMAAIGRSVPTVFQRDFRGTPTNDFERLPLMRDVRSVRDFSVLWVVDYQPNLDWVVFLDPTGRVPIVFASAGIVSTGYFPYVASGQLDGLLAGTRGGAEYEEILRREYGEAFKDEDLRGAKLIVPLAFGHLIIILFIVAGNVGMLAKRRLAKEGRS